MAKDWFECKVKYHKSLETGQPVKVTEVHIVSAVSVSDAESRIIEELSPYADGDCLVIAVKKSNYKELFLGDSERFFQCKVAFISIDDMGDEKKQAHAFLVSAEDFDAAVRQLKNNLKGTLSDWEVVSISETQIVSIFE